MASNSDLVSGNFPELRISASLFEQRFDQFKEMVATRSGEAFRTFSEGLPFKEESYKEQVRHLARQKLQFVGWDESWIGTGQIIRRLISAIEVDEGTGRRRLRNNLVKWDGRHGETGKTHHQLLLAQRGQVAKEPIELAIFRLFRNQGNLEDTFGQLIDAGLRRYDLVAYLFYLHDWEQFCPIAPKSFDRAFQMLEIPLKTSGKLSWENLTRYNSVIAEVKQLLTDVGGMEAVRLIDAHTFCWLLARRVFPGTTSTVEAPLPVVVSISDIPLPRPEDGLGFAGEGNVIDYASRDAERRRIGALAEDIALRSERRRLAEAGRPDLAASSVKLVSNDASLGYDIASVELDGSVRHIEVKAVRRSSSRIQFFLTENELRRSRTDGNYWFYFVSGINTDAETVNIIKSTDCERLRLIPVNYRATALLE